MCPGVGRILVIQLSILRLPLTVCLDSVGNNLLEIGRDQYARI